MTTTPIPPDNNSTNKTGTNTTHDPGPPASITTNAIASKSTIEAKKKQYQPKLDAEMVTKMELIPYR